MIRGEKNLSNIEVKMVNGGRWGNDGVRKKEEKDGENKGVLDWKGV